MRVQRPKAYFEDIYQSHSHVFTCATLLEEPINLCLSSFTATIRESI